MSMPGFSQRFTFFQYDVTARELISSLKLQVRLAVQDFFH